MANPPVKAADPLATVPDPGDTFKNPQQAGFLRRLQEIVSDALVNRAGRLTAVDAILLQAPNGQIYKVTVDNLGVLSAASLR